MKLKISVLILLFFISFPCFSQVRDTTLLGKYYTMSYNASLIQLNKDNSFYACIWHANNCLEYLKEDTKKELLGKYEIINDSLLILRGEKEIITKYKMKNDTTWWDFSESIDSNQVGGEKYNSIYHIVHDIRNVYLIYAVEKELSYLCESNYQVILNFINFLNNSFYFIFEQQRFFFSKYKQRIPSKENLRGLPQYLKAYVLPKPVKTKIANIEKKDDKYVIIFDKGSKQGLKVGMMLYFKSKDEYPIQIVSVEEKTCKGVIEQNTIFLHTKGAKYTTKPKSDIYLKSGRVSVAR